MAKFDIDRMKKAAELNGRYEKQLARLRSEVGSTTCIEFVVNGVLPQILTSKKVSLAIYGDPQSGKFVNSICKFVDG